MRVPFAIPPVAAHPFDIVTLGLNSVDLVGVVASYPERNTKHSLRTFARLPGGQMATAAVACARLGWRASYIGTFGDDDLGRFARESLLQEGIDLESSQTASDATNQFAIVLVDAQSGERTVLWHRHPALAIDPATIQPAMVTSGRMLVVDCHNTPAATQAARYARENGIPTIIDVERVRPGIHELLRHISAIIAAESFPSELTGHGEHGRALHAMADEFPEALLCVTLGDRGSLALCNGREIRTPAFNVTCVDSTGAGDAFRGGFAAACLRAPEGELEEVLRYANAVAALNCRALGARGGLPTRAEVEDLLMQHA